MRFQKTEVHQNFLKTWKTSLKYFDYCVTMYILFHILFYNEFNYIARDIDIIVFFTSLIEPNIYLLREFKLENLKIVNLVKLGLLFLYWTVVIHMYTVRLHLLELDRLKHHVVVKLTSRSLQNSFIFQFKWSPIARTMMAWMLASKLWSLEYIFSVNYHGWLAALICQKMSDKMISVIQKL